MRVQLVQAIMSKSPTSNGLSRRAALGGAAVMLLPRAAAAETSTLIAAASDLQQVLPQLIAAFTAETGQAIRVTYGSTGNFARQIRQGAPFELFMAADESFIDQLTADAVIPDRGVAYAEGRLALVARRSSPFGKTLSLAEIAAAIRAGQALRIAIANPEHAPYGRRALEVLAHQGLSDVIRPRLVFGENVTQALQFVMSGAAAAGLVAQGLLSDPATAAALTVAPIPRAWHEPLIQRMALTAKAGAGARRFYAFLQTQQARDALIAAGFGPPP